MYTINTLKNGVRVVTEHIPYVRSVSMGIWVNTGSRNELAVNSGISHFIEHMFFKGTQRRTAKDIAESIDSIGGQINAFTAKEYTCYYTKTLDTHLDLALDLLSDMFFNSKVDSKDIDVERRVILEEINMYEDSPEELVHDILSETVWSGDPLGYPILGTKDSLEGIDREGIIKYIDSSYTPTNTVIAIAGNFDYDDIMKIITEKFENWDMKGNRISGYEEIKFNNKTVYKEKDTEQVHLCIGFEGIEQGDDRIYDLLVVNSIFGGGMSSRLFQKIREEMGLVYSIYSYPSSYKKAGLFTIYAGMGPNQIDEVTRLISAEISLLKTNKIVESELYKAKEQLKGNYILGLESTSSRMNSIGKSELILGRIKTPDEIIERIDSITTQSVAEIIDCIFNVDKIGVSVVGNIKNNIDINSLIKF